MKLEKLEEHLYVADPAKSPKFDDKAYLIEHLVEDQDCSVCGIFWNPKVKHIRVSTLEYSISKHHGEYTSNFKPVEQNQAELHTCRTN